MKYVNVIFIYLIQDMNNKYCELSVKYKIKCPINGQSFPFLIKTIIFQIYYICSMSRVVGKKSIKFIKDINKYLFKTFSMGPKNYKYLLLVNMPTAMRKVSAPIGIVG